MLFKIKQHVCGSSPDQTPYAMIP